MIDFSWLDNYMYSGDVLTPESFNIDVSDGQHEHLKEVLLNIPIWIRDYAAAGRFTESITHGDFYRRNIVTDSTQITGVFD